MDIRRYNALAGVPWQVMADIRDKVEAMEDGKEKAVLSLYFVEGVSSREIPQRLSELGIRTRSHTDWTARSVQNIVKKHFPELAEYRKKNKDNERRREHRKYLKEHQKMPCAMCGEAENVQLHHPAPIELLERNGVCEKDITCDENSIYLCPRCHARVTAWQRRIGMISGNGRQSTFQLVVESNV